MDDSVLLESWDRQASMIDAIAELVDDSIKDVKSSDDGWTLNYHLAHIQVVRLEWLNSVSPESAEGISWLFHQKDGEWFPETDLNTIRAELKRSAKAIREAMEKLLASGVSRVGAYDHPVFFLQHMIWHEGYHYGLIALALRNAGRGVTDEWEDKHVWGVWRDPEL